MLAMSQKFMELDSRKIMVEEWVKRKYLFEEDLEELRWDIELRELHEEPTVELIDGKPQLISGYCRCLIHLKMGKPLRCRVREFRSDFERWEHHVKENTSVSSSVTLRKPRRPFTQPKLSIAHAMWSPKPLVCRGAWLTSSYS